MKKSANSDIPPRTNVNRDVTYNSSANYVAQEIEEELGWASILCSRRPVPSITWNMGSRRQKQKTVSQSAASDWWRQKKYSWKWCAPRTMGAPVLLISEEDDVPIQFSIFFMRQIFLYPRGFPAKWNVFFVPCPRRSGRYPASSAATPDTPPAPSI